MTLRTRSQDSFITRLGRRIRKDGDGLLALLVGLAAGAVAVLDVFSDLVKPDVLSAAILFVLALLAATLLRDRRSTAALAAQGTAVRQIDDYDADQRRRALCTGTRIWEFRGAVGDVLRTVTLPAFLDRDAAAGFEVRIEILDPAVPGLCREYAAYRALVADRGAASWTEERVREELLATIFAACWYRQRHTNLDVHIGLTSTLHTVRWESADDGVIVSEEGRSGYALVVDAGKPYYNVFTGDMRSTFRRSRQLPVAESGKVSLEGRIRPADVKEVLQALGLSVAGLADRQLAQIAATALAARETKTSALRRAAGAADSVTART